MLYKHFIEKVIGLQGVIITKIEEIGNKIHIFLELERKEQICPCCGHKTNAVHDYRNQSVKDIPAFGKSTVIVLRKRRYKCEHCNKRFAEDNSFLPKYYRMTNRLVAYVIAKLSSEVSFTNVAREVDLSVPTVIRIFDNLSYPKGKLSSAIAIDEFKGNTDGEKYNAIVTDLESGRVLDILPERKDKYLTQYFKQYPREERDKVKYFISDMWKPFYSVSEVWFKQAIHVVDKFHWVRQAIWAFERVRKDVQQDLGKEKRRYFKHSRGLLLKRFDELKDDQKSEVNVMLYISPSLSTAHYLKEEFLKILDCEDRESAKKQMLEWIECAYTSELKPFVSCANTMRNWLPGILNSFTTPYTNGFTEGCNNKIKVLKRNAYGYTNFRRFRNRILHIFSNSQNQKAVTA